MGEQDDVAEQHSGIRIAIERVPRQVSEQSVGEGEEFLFVCIPDALHAQ